MGEPISLDTDSPLPNSPLGEFISVDLGSVTLTTYNPVTLTPLETSTNIYIFYIYATNHGTEPVTLQGPRGWEVEIIEAIGLCPMLRWGIQCL
jgi:hypothetical protein